MTIEEKDFKLEYDEGCNRFDLYILHIVNAKDPEKRREEFKQYGFSMTLEACLKKIINFRISKRRETLSLIEYLKEYKDEIDKLSSLTSLL